jgi:hypothetical protein
MVKTRTVPVPPCFCPEAGLPLRDYSIGFVCLVCTDSYYHCIFLSTNVPVTSSVNMAVIHASNSLELVQPPPRFIHASNSLELVQPPPRSAGRSAACCDKAQACTTIIPRAETASNHELCHHTDDVTPPPYLELKRLLTMNPVTTLMAPHSSSISRAKTAFNKRATTPYCQNSANHTGWLLSEPDSQRGKSTVLPKLCQPHRLVTKRARQPETEEHCTAKTLPTTFPDVRKILLR